MFKTCYLARSFHFLLTFFLHYFSSVSYAISSLEEGVGVGERFGGLDPSVANTPPPLIIPSSSPSFTGSRIFDFYQILYFFFFKVRIFLVKRFRAMYTALYNWWIVVIVIINRRPSFGPSSGSTFRTPTFRFPLPYRQPRFPGFLPSVPYADCRRVSNYM